MSIYSRVEAFFVLDVAVIFSCPDYRDWTFKIFLKLNISILLTQTAFLGGTLWAEIFGPKILAFFSILSRELLLWNKMFVHLNLDVIVPNLFHFSEIC